MIQVNISDPKLRRLLQASQDFLQGGLVSLGQAICLCFSKLEDIGNLVSNQVLFNRLCTSLRDVALSLVHAFTTELSYNRAHRLAQAVSNRLDRLARLVVCDQLLNLVCGVVYDFCLLLSIWQLSPTRLAN